MADIGQCGECKTKPWVKGDFPPCDDSYCTFPYWVTDIDALHLRRHAEGVCRDHGEHVVSGVDWSHANALYPRNWSHAHTELYAYSLDILCLMALTEALGLEYGGFVN